MLKMNSYIRRPYRSILGFYEPRTDITYDNDFYSKYPDITYYSIENDQEIKKYLDEDDDFIPSAIIIEKDNREITNYRFMGSNIWHHFLDIVEELLDGKTVNTQKLYPDNIQIVVKKTEKNEVHFVVEYNFCKESNISEFFQEKEFVSAILNGAKHFFKRLVECGIAVKKHEETLEQIKHQQERFVRQSL